MESPLYRRNPESTQLGRRILATAAELYARHGLEWVTFRKLAGAMDSTEASLYRYFHNKYQLLCYLVWRYWRGVRQELERWNRELPAGAREAQLLLTLLPGPGHELLDEDLHRLVPTFWSWYQTRSEPDEVFCRPVLEEYAAVVAQALAALGGEAGADQALRLQQARMLCQTASCLALFEVLPDYEVTSYRQLWSQLLRPRSPGPETPGASTDPLMAETLNLPAEASALLAEAWPVPAEASSQLAPAEPALSGRNGGHKGVDGSRATAQNGAKSRSADLPVLPAEPQREPTLASSRAISPDPDSEAGFELEAAPGFEAFNEPVGGPEDPLTAASAVPVPAPLNSASTRGIDSPPVTHVMVRKRSGYNLLELQDFMALPPSEQRQLLMAHRLHFISGEGEPIAVQTAIRQLYPAGLK